jgi:phage terminase small subunit
MAKKAATKRTAEAEQPATEEPKGLSDREQRFVAEYLRSLNATKAAQAAGFSEASARTIGSKLLMKPDIAAAIARPQAPPKLTEKQGAFAIEYVRDLNGTRAAIDAGYAPKAASQQAYQLLQIPSVRAEIDKLKAERVERLKMDADQLLMRLLEEVNADVADLFDENDNLKSVSEWPMEFRRGLIGGIEVEEEYGDEDEVDEELEAQPQGGALKRRSKKKRRIAIGRVSKIKLSDRVRRLELIGKHTNVQAFAPKKIEVKADQVLTGLYEKIAGNSIRPRDDGTPR